MMAFTDTFADKKDSNLEDQVKTGYVCTIVNLVPKEINEHKPHLLPSTYNIPAAPKDGFSVSYIGQSIHYIPDPFDEKRSYRQTTTPMEMARSLVDDWKYANIALGENAEPGLFWIEGRHTHKEVSLKFEGLLNRAKQLQLNWYKNLIAMADGDWKKNHNMLAVSDLQKMAAQALGYEAEWLIDTILPDLIICPYCKAKIDPDSVKCYNCKEIVNQKKYDELAGGKK